LPANISDTFVKGFVLDEERLRKIHELLTIRLAQTPQPCKPVYKVDRADNFTYTSEDLEAVIGEENAERMQIANISVSAKVPDFLELQLYFGKDGIKLNIEGEDRDTVFLLFSDLKQYLNAEVDVTPNLQSPEARYWVIFGVILFFSLILTIGTTKTPTISSEKVSQLLESQDVIEKLNFLIQQQISQQPVQTSDAVTTLTPVGIVIVILYPLVFIGLLFWRIQVRFQNVFLFGKEIARQRRRVTILNFYIAGVLIAFLVSVAASLAVWFFTKNLTP
jgi:hypothetical protein